MQLITVKPVQGGWAVNPFEGLPLMFLTGGRAEQKARELAQRAARLGVPTEVRVHDGSGQLVGQIPYGDDREQA